MNNQNQLSCQDIDLLLHYYGEGDFQLRNAIDDHIQECPACAAEMADLQQTLGYLPRPRLELSTAETCAFVDRVVTKLPHRHPQRSWVPLWSATLVATAALLLTFLVPHQTPTPQQVMPSGKAMADLEVIKDLDFLQNLELLEDLELLQELEGLG